MRASSSTTDAAGRKWNWFVECDEHLTAFLKEEVADTFNDQMTILLALRALGLVKNVGNEDQWPTCKMQYVSTKKFRTLVKDGLLEAGHKQLYPSQS